LQRVISFLLSIAFLAAVQGASAQESASVYTSLKAKQCSKPKSQDVDSATWTCPGIAGLIVAISEDDVRQTVSIGRTAAAARKEPAASTQFGPPNVANDAI